MSLDEQEMGDPVIAEYEKQRLEDAISISELRREVERLKDEARRTILADRLDIHARDGRIAELEAENERLIAENARLRDYVMQKPCTCGLIELLKGGGG